MRTKQQEITIYKFNELPDDIKAEAIQRYGIDAIDYNPNDDDGLIDNEKYYLKSYKIGSWDTNPIGAHFDTFDLDYDQFLANASESLRDFRNLWRIYNVQYSPRYGTDSLSQLFNESKTCGRDPWLQIEPDYPRGKAMKRIDLLLTKYAEKLDENIRDAEHDAARSINSEIEHMQSEEYFADLCAANDYEFNENGTLI